MNRHPTVMRIVSFTFALALAGAFFMPAARAQAPMAGADCRKIWDDAINEAARAALVRANHDAGAPPAGAASWINNWTQAWKASWTQAGALLKPDIHGDCCHNDWFGKAVDAGKDSWTKAWQAAPQPAGAGGTWSTKFAEAYADEWAKTWFLHFPWLCAKAKVDAAVTASAKASASAQAGAFAWANAFALAGAFAISKQNTFTVNWSASSASAWAAAGASALASAQASGSASALAYVSGNCAIARASSCADAAAQAFASAWASAGASAFADAYAYAWAQAYAAAFANSWSQAQASAGGVAMARAASQAFASAIADSFAAAWQEKLADHAQLAQIVAYWTTAGAPKPNIRKISSLLALDHMSTTQAIFAAALKKAQGGQVAWTIAFGQAADQAAQTATAEAEAWTITWANDWAFDWAWDWYTTYILVCARAAAAVCVECPCTTTTPSTGTTQERPRTVTRPVGFTYTLVGLGVNSGTIFIITVTNQTGQAISVEIPAGTVFIPNNPDNQREVIDKTQTVDVAPNGSAQAPLTGYCLDYGKQPPPATALGALRTEGVLVASLSSDAILESLPQGSSVKYTVDDNPTKYAPVLKIIQTGNDMSAKGKFHTDMPPDKYKQAVIQRAIWTYTSRGTSTPHTKDTLLADIRKQVKDTAGTQSDAQVTNLVNHLYDDITGVLKTAGVL
jgi:hypothetical protein